MIPVPNELVFTYGIDDLPEALTGPVDPAWPVRRCAFYVAARGSPAIRHAFATLPEPDLEQVPRWMEISKQVATALRQARALVELEDGTPDQIFGMGSTSPLACSATSSSVTRTPWAQTPATRPPWSWSTCSETTPPTCPSP